MDTLYHLVTAIVVIVILYALALLMRRRGALAEEHSLVLARIVTELASALLLVATGISCVTLLGVFAFVG